MIIALPVALGDAIPDEPVLYVVVNLHVILDLNIVLQQRCVRPEHFLLGTSETVLVALGNLLGVELVWSTITSMPSTIHDWLPRTTFSLWLALTSGVINEISLRGSSTSTLPAALTTP